MRARLALNGYQAHCPRSKALSSANAEKILLAGTVRALGLLNSFNRCLRMKDSQNRAPTNSERTPSGPARNGFRHSNADVKYQNGNARASAVSCKRSLPVSGMVSSSPGQLQQLGTANKLILLDKDAQQRSEGTLVGLQPNSWTLNSRQRYDVLMQNMVMVPYQNVPLKRWGVAVI